jgi:hypothetical protein
MPLGRVTAQAVSRWLSITVAQFRPQVKTCEICEEQVDSVLVHPTD